MQTLAYVQLCRNVTNRIKTHVALPKAKRDDNKMRAEVDAVVANNTNPTLPSYQRMIELAHAHNLITETAAA